MKRKGYITNTTAVCLDCNGEGTIIINGAHIGHGRYEPDTKETCETCEGSGLVTVTKNTVITITPKKALEVHTNIYH